MKNDIAGVLLAGGLSRRMGGGDKGLLALAGRPLIAHATQRLAPQVGALVLNANGDPTRFAALGLPIAPDETADFPGPLAGVLAALNWVRRHQPTAKAVVSVPADSPFIPLDLVDRLSAAAGDGRAAVAQSRERIHPVAALWPLTARAPIEAALRNGDRKVGALLATLEAIAVPFGDIDIGGHRVDPFLNINTPDDLAEVERWLTRAAPPPPFVFGVAGWKNSGKTTLVERLVARLAAEGLRVATVKHSHHAIDGEREGTDSARHRRAGASKVALIESDRWGLIGSSGKIAWQPGPAPDLEDVVSRLAPADIVIVEGLKSAPIPKIEVRRAGQGEGPPLAERDRTVFAIASDRAIESPPVPVFALDDIDGLARAVISRREAGRAKT